MRLLLGLGVIVLLCQCSQKHPTIRTKPLFLETPSIQDRGTSVEIEDGPQRRKQGSQATDRDYQKTHQLWNEDKNDEALRLAQEILSSESYLHKTDRQKSDFQQMIFQIAYDLQDLQTAEKAFENLNSLLPCSERKFRNTLSLALLYYAHQKQSLAKETLLKEHCPSQNSESEIIQKNFWLYRFSDQEKFNQSQYLKELKTNSTTPNFYTVVAGFMEKKSLVEIKEQESFPSHVSITKEIQPDLQAAENLIQQGSFSNARKNLRQVKKVLFQNPSSFEETLVYLSVLFQATGDHLEAMRILNDLMAIHSTDLVRQSWLNTFHRPHEEEILTLCARWGVDPDLVYALIRQESAFDPGAHSVAGAKGLMQLMPGLAKFILEQWKVPVPLRKKYLFEAKANIPIAIYHLHQLQQIFSHPALIAASYNAGVQRVSKWTRRFGHFPLDVFTEFIPVRETRDYVKYVMRNYWVYKTLKPSSLYSESYQRAGRGDELCLSAPELLTGGPCIH